MWIPGALPEFARFVTGPETSPSSIEISARSLNFDQVLPQGRHNQEAVGPGWLRLHWQHRPHRHSDPIANNEWEIITVKEVAPAEERQRVRQGLQVPFSWRSKTPEQGRT